MLKISINSIGPLGSLQRKNKKKEMTTQATYKTKLQMDFKKEKERKKI